jgi:hypothetical protein
MKAFKTTIPVLFLLLISTAAMSQSSEDETRRPNTIDASAGHDYIKAQILLKRLDEIKKIDKTALNTSEKTVLRKEVKEIKKAMKEIGGGVYLSVGAIIIIVLLLILLL